MVGLESSESAAGLVGMDRLLLLCVEVDGERHEPVKKTVMVLLGVRDVALSEGLSNRGGG